MNMKHASYILAVVEAGGFTAAAEKLHISQPSLSQTVRTVERHLGAELFDRSGKKTALTPAGQKYVEGVREMLSLERNLIGEIAELQSKGRSALCIGISASRSVSLLPLILPEFMRRWPHVSIELKESVVCKELAVGG